MAIFTLPLAMSTLVYALVLLRSASLEAAVFNRRSFEPERPALHFFGSSPVAGGSLMMVSRILGHSSTQVTEATYAALLDSTLAREFMAASG
jgi:integrase